MLTNITRKIMDRRNIADERQKYLHIDTITKNNK